MLDDPRIQKLVYFFFFAGIAVFLIMVGSVVVARYGDIERAARPEGSPVELKEENGRAIVPEEELPETLEEKLLAPSVSLLPSRTETVSSAPAPVQTRKQIFAATQTFLRSWERVSPGSTEYAQRVNPLVRGAGSLAVLRREDVSSLTGLCPEADCSLGSELAGSPELQLSDYDGRRAYVIGYGVVRVIGYQPIGLYDQSYGILLYRSGQKWLVERAAAETLGPVEDI